jgi:glycosyltransferase involved in cell wall biosynthesis
MSSQSAPAASVIICTFNRAPLLKATLESLGRSQTTRAWDIIVVVNNSSDHTRQVVTDFVSTTSLPVRYVFEPRQGKSNALNNGISHAHGDLLLMTDDDVEVDPGWLDETCRAFDEHAEIDYTGGPVTPIWGAPPPAWFDQARSDLWGTVAILDYGPDRFVFEERKRVPLGANMAVRRSLIDRVGAFHPELGRTGRSLLGQEQAEFFSRTRARGIRGMYLPEMRVAHHVPASRLTKQYFRRWWFWKGLSRARVDAIHHATELGLDLRRVPRLARVPRYVWGQIPREILGWLRARIGGRPLDAMRHAMRVAYCLGYIRACWSRRALAPVKSLTAPGVPA